MSPKLVSASLLATLAAAALVAPPALGDYSAPTWNGTGRIWNSYLYSRPAREALRRRQQQGQGPAQGQPAQPARPRPAGTTTFAAGPPAVLAKVPPQERPKIARLLSDCHTVYGRMMAQAGGMTSPAVLNDLATSTTFYLMVAHYLYWNGQPGALPDLQPRQVQNLRMQLRDRFLASGAFAGQNDTEKQMAHDSMILTACVPLVQLTEAKKTGNEAVRRALRPQGSRLLAEIGLTPNSISLAPDGSVLVSQK